MQASDDKPFIDKVRKFKPVEGTKSSEGKKLFGTKEDSKKELDKSTIIDGRSTNIPSGYENVLKLFQNNIIELKFDRKLRPTNSTKHVGFNKRTRRMLCTADWTFVSNIHNRTLFEYAHPRTNRGINWYKKRNLLIVWDFMKGTFRIISLKKWKIIALFDTAPLINRATFRLFYEKYIDRLNDSKRNKFSDL